MHRQDDAQDGPSSSRHGEAAPEAANQHDDDDVDDVDDGAKDDHDHDNDQSGHLAADRLDNDDSLDNELGCADHHDLGEPDGILDGDDIHGHEVNHEQFDGDHVDRDDVDYIGCACWWVGGWFEC